jgi:hypothetical protein
MSKIIESSSSELTQLSAAKPSQLLRLLGKATAELIKAIAEIGLNVLRETIPVPHTIEENIFLKSLIEATLSVAKKRKLLVKFAKFVKKIIRSALKYLRNGRAISTSS